MIYAEFKSISAKTRLSKPKVSSWENPRLGCFRVVHFYLTFSILFPKKRRVISRVVTKEKLTFNPFGNILITSNGYATFVHPTSESHALRHSSGVLQAISFGHNAREIMPGITIKKTGRILQNAAPTQPSFPLDKSLAERHLWTMT